VLLKGSAVATLLMTPRESKDAGESSADQSETYPPPRRRLKPVVLFVDRLLAEEGGDDTSLRSCKGWGVGWVHGTEIEVVRAVKAMQLRED